MLVVIHPAVGLSPQAAIHAAFRNHVGWFLFHDVRVSPEGARDGERWIYPATARQRWGTGAGPDRLVHRFFHLRRFGPVWWVVSAGSGP